MYRERSVVFHEISTKLSPLDLHDGKQLIVVITEIIMEFPFNGFDVIMCTYNT